MEGGLGAHKCIQARTHTPMRVSDAHTQSDSAGDCRGWRRTLSPEPSTSPDPMQVGLVLGLEGRRVLHGQVKVHHESDLPWKEGGETEEAG